MALRNTSESWGWPARLIHWAMAGLVIYMLGVGFYMSNIETDLIATFVLIQTHKSFGFLVFMLAMLRVGWRLANPTPALPSTMPRWQVTASHLSHLALYALIIALPLTGWLMSSASPLNDPDASPFQIKNMVFDLFEMPDPFPKGSESLAGVFHLAHKLSGMALAALLLLHMAAALKHHLVDKDKILKRMTYGR